jgi:hypothetical protein
MMNVFTESEQHSGAPEVRLSVAVPAQDRQLLPFLRVIGSMREWSSDLISDRELARSLRKAALEVERGWF